MHFPDPVSYTHLDVYKRQALYEALGAFYDKKGYMDISHTRIRRYEILQEFLQEYVDEEQICLLYTS